MLLVAGTPQVTKACLLTVNQEVLKACMLTAIQKVLKVCMSTANQKVLKVCHACSGPHATPSLKYMCTCTNTSNMHASTKVLHVNVSISNA